MPEVFAVGQAMLDEPAQTNPAVPPETTDADRDKARQRLQRAFTEWTKQKKGDQPPAGGSVDDRPTAPGLAHAFRRLEHHLRMSVLSINEMRRGPGNAQWGISERLSTADLHNFIECASKTVQMAAAIVIDVSNSVGTPATRKEVETVRAANAPGSTRFPGIATTAATIHSMANRIHSEITRVADPGDQVH